LEWRFRLFGFGRLVSGYPDQALNSRRALSTAQALPHPHTWGCLFYLAAFHQFRREGPPCGRGDRSFTENYFRSG
jgi:hypothetical protein